MAQRRMFSNRITDSAKFLKMPLSSQALYFHLGLHADDDGVVEAFSVMRQTGAVEDDLRILVAKNFVNVLNDDLVAYITDWNENNRIRADRKVDSIYKDLLLEIMPNIELTEPKPRADTGKVTGRPMDNQWTDNGPHRLGKVRLGKVSKGKVNKDSHHLAKPNYDPSSQPYKIASHLLTRIKQRQPDFKEPNLQKWANDIRLAHERDHRDYEKLDWLVDWSQDNSFWQANILSAGKLRKQYDTLIGQAERDRPTNVAPQTREDWFG
ncbi:replication protein [Lactiplantibacillus plantarum]|uniref:replication protein n=1 Tax=Lactiplantibacillus plantarum TaxID=1590 RepID=UPI003BA24BEF